MANAQRVAIVKAKELGLSKGDPQLQFAQLKGMVDVLSSLLGKCGVVH
jgi:proline dehydrogenase